MKLTFIISYDMAVGGDYDELIEAIKSYGIFAHITQSTWAVKTSYSATDIRDHLGEFLPKRSRILVVETGVTGAWRNSICRNEWLEKHL